ncbi:MAG TPA: hypothetical protein DHW42_03810 [Candidatus Marinimicrobia bacterium]|nr:hypothetical protein [Candidatus Neomarinimicrobiota bacterium]
MVYSLIKRQNYRFEFTQNAHESQRYQYPLKRPKGRASAHRIVRIPAGNNDFPGRTKRDVNNSQNIQPGCKQRFILAESEMSGEQIY